MGPQGREPGQSIPFELSQMNTVQQEKIWSLEHLRC